MAKDPKKPVKPYIPSDYLKGSKKVGEKYTAWDTYGQGRPDFGKGAGPGEPYREVEKTVRRPIKPHRPGWAPGGIIRDKPDWAPSRPQIPGSKPGVKPSNPNLGDARSKAIRRRLGWM